ITGIVGPNGCGKSNIMEAFRWCIGEMSWKSLRSDSMVSVIFAGTTRRNPMNLAEVTLTFDNASKLLPLQYSEISVTRRIYRSGESEYFLNRTQCRLRDIRELFLDTGIGNAGYAIIDQGGVDFVLKSKPEERRALFEEAAGVSKYKAKRQEALRKLDRVEIDLGRLQDSVTLINEQIKKLDSDARKAKLFQKYKSELGAVEAGQIIQEIGAIDKDIGSENEQLAPVSRRLEELQTGVGVDEARHAALNLERTSQESAVIESNQKIAASKSEIGRLEERIENAKTTVRDLEEQLNSSREEIEREAERAVAINPLIEKARREFEEAKAAFVDAKGEADAFSADFKKIEDARAAAGGERAGLRRELLASAAAIQESDRRLSSGESRVTQLDYEVRRTLRELEKKIERIETTRGEAAHRHEVALAQRKRSDEARAGASSVEEKLSGIRTELTAISEETLQRHGEKARIQAQVEALEAQGQRDPYWVGAHAVVNAGLPGVVGTVRSLIRVDEAHRAAVEDLLGERLFAVVCSSAAAAKAGIEFLKGAGRGRARFLVSSSLPAGSDDSAVPPAEAVPVIDHVRFDPAHEAVVRYLLGESYVTGEGIYGRHWVCGGAPADAGAPLKISDIEDLKKRFSDAESSLAELGRRKEERGAALAAAETELSAARERLSEVERETHRFDAEYNQRAESLSASEEEISLIESEAARGLRDMAETREAIIESKAVLEDKRASEGGLKTREAEADQRFAALSEDVAAKRVEKEHLEKSLSNYESQRSF
ncbi:MAG: AAA family ATPase, partial [Elusimicrobiota bacterium]